MLKVILCQASLELFTVERGSREKRPHICRLGSKHCAQVIDGLSRLVQLSIEVAPEQVGFFVVGHPAVRYMGGYGFL